MKSADAGFTLLEVLVSFAVAGLVVAIVVPSSILARKRLMISEQQWQAAQTSMALIETIASSGKTIEPQKLGAWQASSRITYVDGQERAPFRLARVEVVLTALQDTKAEPIVYNSLRLVPVDLNKPN
jgi:prepilin-type N-terminal cleavage/methylation domain-containing protein